MFFVYILYSQKDKGLYVGHTNNLISRLKKHNDGLVQSTKHRRPLVLLYKEPHHTRAIAMKREKYFKNLYSARFKQKLIQEYLRKHKNLK